MAAIPFSVAEVEPQTNTFDALPAGWYVAQVIESDMKQTKAGTGQYLQLTWEILDGPCRGRRVWDRLNIVHQKAEVEEMSRKKLAQICVCVGLVNPPLGFDSVLLHGKPCRINLNVRKDLNFGDSNEVKGYEKAAGIVPAATIPAAAASAAGSAPWLKP